MLLQTAIPIVRPSLERYGEIALIHHLDMHVTRWTLRVGPLSPAGTLLGLLTQPIRLLA